MRVEMVTPHPVKATLSQGVFNSRTNILSDLHGAVSASVNTFHVHGQDKPGRELFRKQLSRRQMMRFLANLPACTG